MARVKNLIEASKSRVCQQRIKEKRYLGHSRFQCLPMELLHTILDFLACKDIQRLQTTLGISVPRTYWRRRAGLFLVEKDEIADDDICWEYLCRKWEQISDGQLFRDHNFIVGILRERVKPTYMKNLKQRTFPPLEKVIAGI